MNSTTYSQYPRGIDGPLRVLGVVGRLGDAVRLVETWRKRHQTRAQMAEVDARILRDIGMSRAQRFIEINKPFWEA